MGSLYQTLPSSSTHVRLTSERPFTPEFVQTNLHHTHSKVRAQALYEERIRKRQLVIARKPRPASSPVCNDSDAQVRVGRREAAEKGLWRLRASEAKWELFVPLHRLWCAYIAEVLGLPSASAGMHAKLVKADFHGSIVRVRRSRNAVLVGREGIVVQETENTFKVVTRDDKLKVLPKQGSVFVFAVPHHTAEVVNGTVLDGPHVEMELYGNQFCFRAADRAGRKFKHKESIEL